MPIVFRREFSWGVVAAWKIAESEEDLLTAVNQSDIDSIAGIGSSSKRVERLSWRALLRSVMASAGDVVYDKYGAPHVEGVYLSVSHNSEYAVIALSERVKCAIDIELCTRNFGRVAHRYISKDEADMVGLSDLDCVDRDRVMCAIWCAKEVLYKYSGRDGLDFLSNLKINSYESGAIVGKIIDDGAISVGLNMAVLELGSSLLVVGACDIVDY